MFQRFFGDRFNVPPETQLSLGSGVIVSRDGYILTNDHVVEGVTDIQVTLPRRAHGARRRSWASTPTPTSPWCASPPTGLTPITFGQSDQARVGDIVLAIGDPFSVGQTVTMGIVSAVGREIGSASPFGSFIQTDAAINPGNSGGALVDTNGNLIGINTLIFSRTGGYQGIGFAIPGEPRQARDGADHRDAARSRAAGSAWRWPTSARELAAVARPQGHARRHRRRDRDAAARRRRAASRWAT